MQNDKPKFNILRSKELWELSADFNQLLNQKYSCEFSISHREINLAEIVTGAFQMMDFSWTVFKQLSPIVHRADALIQKLNWADSGLIVAGEIRPMMLSEKVFSEMISSQNTIVYREYCVSIVGELSTFASFVNLCQRLGFKKINFYCDASKIKEAQDFSENAIKLFINLKIDVKVFDELVHTEELSSLLIVDADFEIETELFQNLSYFNFLSPRSIFIDFRSDRNNLLQLEAEKAELVVLDGREFFMKKYQLASEIVGNR